jgi:hypothetical protein
MAGLDPAIQRDGALRQSRSGYKRKDVDGRVEPGHDSFRMR